MTINFVEPLYFWNPDSVGSYGSEAIDLCKLGKWTFDPEQEFALDAIMSVDKFGYWVSSEAAVVCARQNGKTNRILIPRALWQLYLGPVDEVIWTAHRFVTSTKAFRDIKTLIDGTYELRRRVKSMQASYGKETIELIDGSIMRFLARSQSGGRGLGGPLPCLDEAMFVKPEQLGALLPIILARPEAQVMYGSSAGLEDSEVLRDIRDRGRAGNDPTLCYIEWGTNVTWDKPLCELDKCDHHRSRKGCSLDNEEYWNNANFALDRRIRRATVRTLRKQLTPLQFGREIMSIWDKDPDSSKKIPIKPVDWDLCKNEDSEVVGAISLIIEISANQEFGCIAIGGFNEDKIPHLEIVRYEQGTDWMIDEIVRIKNTYKLLKINIARGKDRDRPKNKRLTPAVVLDPSGPASVLIPDLFGKKIVPVFVNSKDLGLAYSTLERETPMHGAGFVHIGQEQVELAIGGSAKRTIGDGLWIIHRAKSAENEQTDISTLNALAMARWALLVAEAPSVGEPQVYVF